MYKDILLLQEDCQVHFVLAVLFRLLLSVLFIIHLLTTHVLRVVFCFTWLPLSVCRYYIDCFVEYVCCVSPHCASHELKYYRSVTTAPYAHNIGFPQNL